MYPVDSPGIFGISTIPEVFTRSGYNNKLVGAYFITVSPDGIPSTASHTIDQDVIATAVPALAMVESSSGEIPYMRDVDLADGRKVLYKIAADRLW
jgi:hypothetical protein